MASPRPAVSVSIITYNQRELIGRAIDSALMQQTDFDFEIIVGDDCSDDGTQEVLRAYQARHPDRIQLILHPRRYRGEVPGRTNNVTNLHACRGRYIAMLDGDDYWTDPHKLQRQYHTLESYPEVALCLHDVYLEYAGKDPAEAGFQHRKSDQMETNITGFRTHRDLASRDFINPHMSSVMFRADYLRPLPDWFYEVVAADYALLCLLSKRGTIYYDARPAGVYYITPKSFMRTYLKKRENLVRMLRDLDTFAHYVPASRLSRDNTRRRARIHFWLAQLERREGNRDAMLKNVRLMCRADLAFGLSMMLNPLRKLRDKLMPHREAKVTY